jgi:hypothetical protein
MPGRLEPVAMVKVKKDFPNEFILYLCSGRFLHSTDGKTSRSTSITSVHILFSCSLLVFITY